MVAFSHHVVLYKRRTLGCGAIVDPHNGGKGSSNIAMSVQAQHLCTKKHKNLAFGGKGMWCFDYILFLRASIGVVSPGRHSHMAGETRRLLKTTMTLEQKKVVTYIYTILNWNPTPVSNLCLLLNCTRLPVCLFTSVVLEQKGKEGELKRMTQRKSEEEMTESEWRMFVSSSMHTGS